MARIFGNIVVAPKGITKIQQVMHESGVLTCALHRVQAVLTFGIGVVDPGKENIETPQVRRFSCGTRSFGSSERTSA